MATGQYMAPNPLGSIQGGPAPQGMPAPPLSVRPQPGINSFAPPNPGTGIDPNRFWGPPVAPAPNGMMGGPGPMPQMQGRPQGMFYRPGQGGVFSGGDTKNPWGPPMMPQVSGPIQRTPSAPPQQRPLINPTGINPLTLQALGVGPSDTYIPRNPTSTVSPLPSAPPPVNPDDIPIQAVPPYIPRVNRMQNTGTGLR